MTDVHTRQQRSFNMSRIRRKDTKPEMQLRRGLHALGFRYRLHSRDLAGRPDIVLPKYRAAIFVNGCFWHGHDCPLFVVPQTNTRFWTKKIDGNRTRDQRNIERLHRSGWRVLTVWECALKGKDRPPFEQVLEEVAGWILSADDESEIPPDRGG